MIPRGFNTVQPFLLRLATAALIGTGLLFTTTAQAARPEGLELDPLADVSHGFDGIDRLSLPLSDLAGGEPVFRLIWSKAQRDVVFNVSPSVALNGATLTVRMTNSNVLIKRSQVSVLLNDKVVAQLPLAREEAFIEAKIVLDPGDFKPGINKLSFAAAQHYTLQCEDPVAPELWSEIDLKHSSIDLSWQRQPMTARLSQLDDLFAYGVGGTHRLRVLLPDAKPDAALMASAGMVVQRVAQAQKFIQPDVQAAALSSFPQPLASRENESDWLFAPTAMGKEDAVLVGTVEQLKPYVTARVLDQVTDGFVGLYPSPADPTRFLMLISGRDETELQRAATAISVINFPFADDTSMLVRSIDLPDNFRPASHPPIGTEREYSFADFGFKDKLFVGRRHAGVELNIPVPGDYYVTEGTQLRLGLDFGYSNGLRADSSLNIFLNDRLLQSIPLDDERGIGYRDFGIYIDFRELQSGNNRIRFDPVLVPASQGECTDYDEESMLLSLESSSTLTTPPGVAFASLPDLGNLARTGYPLVSTAGQDDFDVLLASHDLKTVEAAWLVLGRLSQITGRVFNDIAYLTDPGQIAPNHHVLSIGEVGDVTALPATLAPVRLGNPNDVPYVGEPVQSGRPARTALETHAGPVYATLRAVGLLGDRQLSTEVSTTRLVQVNDIGRNALIQAYRRPDSKDRLMPLVTAGTADLLKQRVQELVHPAYWSQLAGDMVVWRDEPNSLAHARAGEPFEIGSLNTAERFRFMTAAHPLVFVGAILGCVLVISLIVVFAVRNLRRRSEAPDE